MALPAALAVVAASTLASPLPRPFRAPEYDLTFGQL